jgi:hypothetical protein
MTPPFRHCEYFEEMRGSLAQCKSGIPEESKERLPRQSLTLLSRNDDETVGPQ